MIDLEKESEIYARKACGVYYDDKHPDCAINDSMGEITKKDFKAGFEFAQKWFSLSEKLPDKQGHYLVIAPQSFPKNCKVVVAEFDFDAKIFYSESSDSSIKDATHWRCIDFL